MVITKENGIIKVLNRSTSESIQELKQLFAEGKISPDQLTSAHIKYDCKKGVGLYGAPGYYPLKFSGKKEVWVSCVTSGYNGEGPHGTIEALKIAGFVVTERTEDLIHTIKKMDHFLFKRPRPEK